MAEAIGAAYALETAVEGGVAATVAVSGKTVPLHAKFQKVKSPKTEDLRLSGSQATIIKNKLYINGGELYDESCLDRVHVVSFLPDFSALTTDASKPLEVDYEAQKPVIADSARPLKPPSTDLIRHKSIEHSPRSSFARIKHTSTAIEDRIYVLGGFFPSSKDRRSSNSQSIISLETVLGYNTLDNTYTVVAADPAKCTEGIPEARYSASCSSSPLPPPISVAEGDGPSLDAHGTIFLHGGYDVAGHPLHDTWTFDLGSKAWHKFPTIVEEVVDQHAPGRIAYHEGRLWYVNGSTVMHLDLAERDPQPGDIASNNPEVLSTGRVGSGQWQVVYPTPEADLMSPAQPTEKQTHSDDSSVPKGPTAAILPITTGSGRQYLLSIPPTNPQNMHLFQLPSSPKTATSIKDTIRDKLATITRLGHSWSSGKFEWSKVEVIQLSKEEGEIERPHEELTEFAVSAWPENGDKIAIWGGKSDSRGTENEGWVVTFD